MICEVPVRSKAVCDLRLVLFDFSKAIKFYTYDVCFNSQRIDSWAGLALSKMSQLEQKLNSVSL